MLDRIYQPQCLFLGFTDEKVPCLHADLAMHCGMCSILVLKGERKSSHRNCKMARAVLSDLLLQLKQQFSLSYLFITHDLAAVAYLADAIAVTQAGAIVESLDSVYLNQLTHPYSQQLIAAQLPTHPRDRTDMTEVRTDLARDRNRMAADRTMMAWIRTVW